MSIYNCFVSINDPISHPFGGKPNLVKGFFLQFLVEMTVRAPEVELRQERFIFHHLRNCVRMVVRALRNCLTVATRQSFLLVYDNFLTYF